MKIRIAAHAAKGACFLIGLVVLLLAASWLFMPKNNHKAFGFTDEEMLAGGILGERDKTRSMCWLWATARRTVRFRPCRCGEEHGFFRLPVQHLGAAAV